jgi:hypothetical protein
MRNFVSSTRPWPSGVRIMAMSARTSVSPTVPSTHGPSTCVSPSSSIPSSAAEASCPPSIGSDGRRANNRSHGLGAFRACRRPRCRRMVYAAETTLKRLRHHLRRPLMRVPVCRFLRVMVSMAQHDCYSYGDELLTQCTLEVTTWLDKKAVTVAGRAVLGQRAWRRDSPLIALLLAPDGPLLETTSSP